MSTIWKNDRIHEIYDIVAKKVQETFNNMKKIGYEYREGQNEMANEVVTALASENILLVEAGVGIGKSFAYLLPILLLINEYKKENRDLGPIIISTSTLALQEQLAGDISLVENIIGMNGTDVPIAKGMNNYACLKKVEKQLLRRNITAQERLVLADLQKIALRNDLTEKKGTIENYLWQRVRASNPEDCQNCPYSAKCLMPKTLESYKKADIIITNHAYLTSLVKNNSPLIKNASTIVIDEAHNLDNAIRNVYEENFRVVDAIRTIDRILYKSIVPIFSRKDAEMKDYILRKYNSFYSFFKVLKESAQYYYRTHQKDTHIAFSDCTDLSFNRKGKHITDACNQLAIEINELLNRAEISRRHCGYLGIENDIEYLKKISFTLKDIMSPTSNYIYYTRLYRSKGQYGVNLIRTPRSLKEIITKLINNRATIMTSATLTSSVKESTAKTYTNFARKLGLDMPGITTAKPKASTFNYQQNSLLYYDTIVPSPRTENHNNYLISLSKKIDKLISITFGKSLVLFTNKQDMERCYNILTKYRKYPFNIYIQNENNSQSIGEKFAQDINSVLFATGAFWEGIDLPGITLSQVIITKLPFPTVDPIIEDKASKYKDSFNEIYYPEMLTKLIQGAGRALRSPTDKSIISILDSRFPNYPNLTQILSTYPITNNIADVIKFSNQHITRKPNKPVVKLRKKTFN